MACKFGRKCRWTIRSLTKECCAVRRALINAKCNPHLYAGPLDRDQLAGLPPGLLYTLALLLWVRITKHHHGKAIIPMAKTKPHVPSQERISFINTLKDSGMPASIR